MAQLDIDTMLFKVRKQIFKAVFRTAGEFCPWYLCELVTITFRRNFTQQHHHGSPGLWKRLKYRLIDLIYIVQERLVASL